MKIYFIFFPRAPPIVRILHKDQVYFHCEEKKLLHCNRNIYAETVDDGGDARMDSGSLTYTSP